LALPRNLIELSSRAGCWQDLARDLVRAIDQLEARNTWTDVQRDDRSIVLLVEPGMKAIRLAACGSDGLVITPTDAGIRLRFRLLPVFTDQDRDDGMIPQNASIDRAACWAAAEMKSWVKEPDTFELVEHQRFILFLAWPEGTTSRIDELAYGLWDE
jgi:hypothetical protein